MRKLIDEDGEPIFMDKTDFSSETKFEYPVLIGQSLILSPFKSKKQQDRTGAEYMLFSVISHSGDATAGHYIPTVRVGDDWFKCNDQELTTVKVSRKEWQEYLNGKYEDKPQPFTPSSSFTLEKISLTSTTLRNVILGD